MTRKELEHDLVRLMAVDYYDNFQDKMVLGHPERFDYAAVVRKKTSWEEITDDNRALTFIRYYQENKEHKGTRLFFFYTKKGFLEEESHKSLTRFMHIPQEEENKLIWSYSEFLLSYSYTIAKDNHHSYERE